MRPIGVVYDISHTTHTYNKPVTSDLHRARSASLSIRIVTDVVDGR